MGCKRKFGPPVDVRFVIVKQWRFSRTGSVCSYTSVVRRRRAAAVLTLLCAAIVIQAAPARAETVLYRVDSGGPGVATSPAWEADTTSQPSPYVNAAATGNTTFSTSSEIDMTDPSVPPGTPMAVFQTERWDESGGSEMSWDFPVAPGTYEVRLYFAEIWSGAQSPGARLFDVAIEGTKVLDDYDVYADVGANKGVVKTSTAPSDSNLDIDFTHVLQNPAIKAIEILRVDSPGTLGALPQSVDFGNVAVGSNTSKAVQLINQGGPGDPGIVVESTSISGSDAAQFSDDFNDAGSVTVPPGQSTTLSVTLAPNSSGQKSAALQVTHSGTNSPLSIPLSGNGGSAPVGFGKASLQGESSDAPTSLQFGPDGRLYVAQFNGLIKAYTVQRNAANSYSVTSTETIGSIQSIPNHNDNGALNASVSTRLVTGLLVTGTAANPVIYVTSSDPRIGAGPDGGDLNLDTNSSMISRLKWNGASWQKLDLVRGLPRSEENHAANGLALDETTSTLYVAQGGNTNKGAPSNNFAFLPEFAFSAAVLSVDLDAIGESTYDLPTLDDEDRAGTSDANDPFGGNDGKNQAKIVPLGPVQVHAPGFRNPYDLTITKSGRMYTIDNGGNAGWGDVPASEGPGGVCTNEPRDFGTTDPDSLRLITGAGYYGGHPNPTRGNTNNKFNLTNPQSPVPAANAQECDYLAPTSANGALTTWSSSVDGLDEYTAGNFGGAMDGDLIAADYGFNSVRRVELSSDGTAVQSNSALFSSVGSAPLDLTTTGSAGPFPGTIWVADHGNGQIYAFEPSDYDETGSPCTGVDDPSLDEDNDGYDNADEIDNGTSPCSAGDKPPDWDGDFTSNLNDPDDDNDGVKDESDAFAIDPNNGTTTDLPVSYTWENDAPNPGGLLKLGFTGLMTNGSTNYENQFDPAKMTAGGAAGVVTVDEVPAGDARGVGNDQQYGFQFGVDPSSVTGRFTARTRIMAPFAGMTPAGNQSMGLFIGNGDQNNYVRLATAANDGSGGIHLSKEVAGAFSDVPEAAVSMPGPDFVDLYLTVDPSAATVQASYSVTKGGSTSARTNLGAPQSIPSGWLTGSSKGLAVGIISTSAGGAPFPATWDFIQVAPEGGGAASTIAEDSFSRTVSGGLGSADKGGAWSLLAGSSGDFSVDGSKAVIAASKNGQRVAHLGSTSARDVDASVEITFPNAVSGSGGHFGYLLLRRSAGGAYYRIGLFTNSAGKVGIRAESQNGKAVFPDVDTGLTFSPGDSFKLRVQLEGASPTAVRVKAWKAGGSEPAAWTKTAADSTVGPQAAGSIGVRVLNTARAATTLKLDSLLVNQLSGGQTPPPPTGTWQTRAPTGLARQEVSYVELAGKLYLAGGGTSQQKYDPQIDSWTNVAPLPESLDHIQAVATGGRIYYIGGLNQWPAPQSAEVYIYDPATDSFSQGAPMPSGRARGAGAVAVHNGRIYYAGGLHDGIAVPWLDVYDPVANSWTPLPNMPTARDHFHAAVIGGKLYAIGGRNVNISATTPVNEVYDITANRWSTGFAPLPTPRGGFAAAALGDEILIIGGEGAGSQTFNTVEAYNVTTNMWRTLAPMPTARHGIQAAVCNGGIYIAAGGKLAGGSQPTDVHEVFFLGAPAPCNPS
jgi:Malectin domain/Kelch motif/Abnormal spindle-like microcephaly-assoc'd, ASPM-SPD-2-Hydin